MILAAMGVAEWVLLGLVILLMLSYPILMRSKNKREQEKLVEQTNSLKRGDKILTTSGVYGTIMEVREEDGAKKVVIETGNAQYKSYMSIDAYAIYTVLKDEKELKKEEKETKSEEKKEENKASNKKETKKDSKNKTLKNETSEDKAEIKIDEKPKAQKKAKSKKEEK